MLGRQAVRAGLRTWRGMTAAEPSRALAARSYATEKPSGEALPSEFKDAWRKVAPNLDLPRFPVSYMKPRPQPPATIPTSVTVNFVLPYKFEIQAREVDMVIVPASTGQLGVLPGHVPTIAELKPGILSIHEGDNVQKYFVSSGFAFAHPNSVLDIVVVEGVSLDQVDPEAVKTGLAEYSEKVNTANTDLEKAEALIGLEVYSSLNSVISG
ncbi:unnamed protein product [Calypogeia fissa]